MNESVAERAVRSLRSTSLWRGPLVLLLGAAVVTACGAGTGDEVMPSAVPTDGTRWLCPGVSEDSVILITGESPDVEVSTDADGSMFRCRAVGRTGTESDPGIVHVRWGDLTEANRNDYMGDESVRAQFPDHVWTVPGAQGDGAWAVNGDDNATAQWVCAERYIEVYVALKRDDEGVRDPAADARNLLVSILPWGCGDVPVPGVTPTATPRESSSA